MGGPPWQRPDNHCHGAKSSRAQEDRKMSAISIRHEETCHMLNSSVDLRRAATPRSPKAPEHASTGRQRSHSGESLRSSRPHRTEGGGGEAV